jgi:N-acetylglutamate synthase-like GNAT family acetyltransferase
VILRPARAEDRAAIRQIVREARINPTGLDWRRFAVAEDDGQIVATGQIKPHRDGSRELASIATRPAYQRRGIASALIRHLLAASMPPLYLVCAAHNAGFYPRLGFRPIQPSEMPPYFRRMHRLINLLAGTRPRLVVMRWDG